MNIFEFLSMREKRILSLLLKGLPMSKVANIFNSTTDDVDSTRLTIITKLEKIFTAEVN